MCGRYVALVEHGGGSQHRFIFIPEEMEGVGWRWLAEALWEVASEGRASSHSRGGAPLRPLVLANPLQKCFYKEASVMMQPHKGLRGRGNGAVAFHIEQGVVSGTGAVHNGEGVGRDPYTVGADQVQGQGGDGRIPIGMPQVDNLCTLQDKQVQLMELQKLVETLNKHEHS